jgi:hypothetical protein
MSPSHSEDDGDADARLLQALRAADRRRPWTVDAVQTVASDPVGTKATSPVCVSCDAPCEDDEVCMTVIVDEFSLLEEVGRDRAFHLVESGAKRLRTTDDGRIRQEGDRRPNFFFALSTDED